MRWKDVLLILVASASFMLIVTPFINPYGTLTSLDGSVGAIDHYDLWTGSDVLTMVTYLLGDVFCPQIMSRSFILNGNQMAFCMRDVSILFGILIGLISSYTRISKGIDLRTSMMMTVCAFVILMMDWSIQHITGVDVAISRILTGAFFGFALSCILSSYENLIHRM